MNAANILIVEDDGVLATHLGQILQEMGYAIAGVAATGLDAIARAKERRPDVVLMDVRLRGPMSGVEAAREIHKDLEVPVIYLTAYTDEELMGQAKTSAPYAYLTKPVREQELRASIEIALYRNAAERHIQRLNDVLHSVCDINQLIAREQDPSRLLHQACQIIVRARGYRLACIAGTDASGQRLETRACAGEAIDLAKVFMGGIDEKQRARWPCMRAFHNRQPVIVHDFATDSESGLWRELALAHRIGSQAAMPMLQGGLLYGVLCVGAEQAAAFDSEEIVLLTELAGDLALALQSIHNETQRRKAEAEKERLQEQLMQAQKMESVGRLAGGVAHDFNNMLQAILGNTALALEAAPPDSPLREHLEEIHKSALRSADLTRQLLAFARKQTIQPVVLDLNETIGGMLKMIRRLIGENIDLAWMPGAGVWPVRLDPSQISQVLANLCLNARDAIRDSGRVSLQTTNVVLDQAYTETHAECVPGDYVMLAVSDTGQGMDAATRRHLFEPFFTTKDTGKGTGLGLATVFGIVKQNNGHINVYSEPGQGTVFKIYLPRAHLETEGPSPTSAPRSLRGTETVLLVEDEEQVMTLGRRILERHGYTVLAAPTPEAAQLKAKEHAGRIDLLVTDVVMPGLNGKALLERLRIERPELKCVFMSGYTADVIAHHGVLEEGVLFLQKPFTTQRLTEKVREALEGKGDHGR